MRSLLDLLKSIRDSGAGSSHGYHEREENGGHGYTPIDRLMHADERTELSSHWQEHHAAIPEGHPSVERRNDYIKADGGGKVTLGDFEHIASKFAQHGQAGKLQGVTANHVNSLHTWVHMMRNEAAKSGQGDSHAVSWGRVEPVTAHAVSMVAAADPDIRGKFGFQAKRAVEAHAKYPGVREVTDHDQVGYYPGPTHENLGPSAIRSMATTEHGARVKARAEAAEKTSVPRAAAAPIPNPSKPTVTRRTGKGSIEFQDGGAFGKSVRTNMLLKALRAWRLKG